MELKVLAWLSDHDPNDDQREDLIDLGYRIIHVPSPQPERWSSSTAAVAGVLRKCGGIPDAVMMILPEVMGGGFMLEMDRHARQHDKKIIYIQPEMVHTEQHVYWTGYWVQLKGVRYEQSRWKGNHSRSSAKQQHRR